jgi:hypothetical protein
MYFDIDVANPRLVDIHKNLPFAHFIRSVVGGITNLFWIVRSFGISLDESPFSSVLAMGANPWVTGILLVVVPAVILAFGAYLQHGYYIKKYFDPIRPL